VEEGSDGFFLHYISQTPFPFSRAEKDKLFLLMTNAIIIETCQRQLSIFFSPPREFVAENTAWATSCDQPMAQQ
jgi:hypothetical protein